MVRFILNPTVPNAETTSNNNLINDMFGLIIDNIKVMILINRNEILMVTIDSFICLSDISLLNTETLFFYVYNLVQNKRYCKSSYFNSSSCTERGTTNKHK